MKAKRLVGIDLAWQSDKNSTALALGELNGQRLNVLQVEPSVRSVDKIKETIANWSGIAGIAIDAPLVINNAEGQRKCETEIGREYGARKASCHTSNLTLYPSAKSVSLSRQLKAQGFSHLSGDQWQIECYPHPAIIECFDLQERLPYKKGSVADKRAGQVRLSELLKSLATSSVLKLQLAPILKKYLDVERINILRGDELKQNEDVLDAILCLYIAGLFATNQKGKLCGSIQEGYIWVPTVCCI